MASPILELIRSNPAFAMAMLTGGIVIARIVYQLVQWFWGLPQGEPVPVPVVAERIPPHIRRALEALEERHARGEISDSEYLRQLERLQRQRASGN